MALTNAQKQARWRDKRNEEARALKGKPKEIAERILRELGVKEAARVVRALDKRLRNIKPDCPRCNGTGIDSGVARTQCGTPLGFNYSIPCDCKPEEPEPEGWLAVRQEGENIRRLPVRATEAEAQQDAEGWREHHASLKRKPRRAGPICVITTAEYDAMTNFDSCPVD